MKLAASRSRKIAIGLWVPLAVRHHRVPILDGLACSIVEAEAAFAKIVASHRPNEINTLNFNTHLMQPVGLSVLGGGSGNPNLPVFIWQELGRFVGMATQNYLHVVCDCRIDNKLEPIDFVAKIQRTSIHGWPVNSPNDMNTAFL